MSVHVPHVDLHAGWLAIAVTTRFDFVLFIVYAGSIVYLLMPRRHLPSWHMHVYTRIDPKILEWQF